MSTETIGVVFDSGGCVELVVDVDWLSIGEDDFRFVRSLVDRIRAHGKVVDQAMPPPLPPAIIVAATAAMVAPRAAREITSAPSVRGVPKKGKGGRKPAVDYNNVAEFMAQVRAEGGAVQSRIAERWNVPLSTAKNWMARCREMALVPTTDVPVYDGDAVVACYLEALEQNRRPIQSVADRFDCDKSTAAAWVRRARAEGLLPPAHEPQLPADIRRRLLDGPKPEPVA